MSPSSSPATIPANQNRKARHGQMSALREAREPGSQAASIIAAGSGGCKAETRGEAVPRCLAITPSSLRSPARGREDAQDSGVVEALDEAAAVPEGGIGGFDLGNEGEHGAVLGTEDSTAQPPPSRPRVGETRQVPFYRLPDPLFTIPWAVRRRAATCLTAIGITNRRDDPVANDFPQLTGPLAMSPYLQSLCRSFVAAIPLQQIYNVRVAHSRSPVERRIAEFVLGIHLCPVG